MPLLRWLEANIEKYVCVILFMVIVAIMIVNVFMRFVLDNAIPWASDLVLFIFVWFIWFAISYGLKEGAHVNVTVVVSLLPKKMQLMLKALCNLLTISCFALLLVVGIQLLSHFSVVGKTGLLIKYPMWSLYLATPVGITLCLFRLVQNSVRELRGEKGAANTNEEAV